MTAGVTRRLAEVEPAPSVVTIGVFDGVHRGHRALLDLVVERARARGVRAVVVTFDRHPALVVAPDAAPCMLQPTEQRIADLAGSGVDLVHVLEFDRAAARQSAVDFVAEVLGGPLSAVEVVVGRNFRFGHGAAGDVDLLARQGAVLGFEATAIDLVGPADAQVSSTAIRRAVRAGDVTAAGQLRGRPHVVRGRVVRGDGRGRTIGVPTANVEVDAAACLPGGGVYATMVAVDGTSWPSVTNIGTRPTFGGRTRTVEAHLLDAEVDLYDATVDVAFVSRLRGERRFDGPDALVAQIRDDIEAARAALSSRPDWDRMLS